jgi:hypothetical protein
MSIPSSPLERFRTSAVNLVTDTLTARIAARLRADGVRLVVLKGASFREWLYEDDEERRSDDVDVLVPPDARERVHARLAALGLRSIGPTKVGHGRSQEWWWHEPKTGIIVELHESLSGVGVDNEAAWHVLSEHTVRMKVAGETVEVLDLPRRALHLALHAAHHGPAYPRPIADLERGIAALPEQTWREAVDVARRLDAVPALVAGLRLAETGRGLVANLGLAKEEMSRADVALRAAGAPPGAEGFAWLLEVHGARGKLGVVAQALAPPPGVIRAWSPLARRNSAGLSVMYLCRPLWLARHAIPALTAVRRADRDASASGPSGNATPATAAEAAEEAWLALRMLGWSLLLPVLKRTVPLRTLARWTWTSGAGPRRPEREERIVRLSAALARLRPHLRPNCLERSLLAYRFLSQAGAQPRLVVGVRREPTVDVAGHAWVEVDGRAVHDRGTDLQDLVRIVEFGHRGLPVEPDAITEALPGRWT